MKMGLISILATVAIKTSIKINKNLNTQSTNSHKPSVLFGRHASLSLLSIFSSSCSYCFSLFHADCTAYSSFFIRDVCVWCGVGWGADPALNPSC